MRSIPTLLGTAALGAGLLLAAPAAQAATAPQAIPAACSKAVQAAEKAESAYQAALADYKKQVKAGGHPGKAEQDNLAALESAANGAASFAARVCPDAKIPSGSMHTGSGSTSTGVNTADLAAGAALIGAVGIGAVALRRRHSGSQA